MSKRFETTESGEDTVYAGPTKRFFVGMLTRDIDLDDAILDLLDNCVDGAMRVLGDKLVGDEPFKGFWAEITLNSNRFEIHDNCGGIEWSIFKSHAFALGRPDVERDKNIPTIGMYGIGMKRAIFKMAEEATVATQVADRGYSVTYTKKWLDESNDEDWELPIIKSQSLLSLPGTRITATELKEDVKKQFGDDAGFLAQLQSKVSQYFGYIIESGFSVKINGSEIRPQTLKMHTHVDLKNNRTRTIAPYVFTTTHDGVQIDVIVGFRGPLPSESEIWDEMDGRRTSEDAGVSVICNDRVVILNDKNRLTGWGDGGVPKYHNQFIAVAGIVFFRSNNASFLPVSTTKRQLDAGSELFLIARSRLMDGLKRFTDFTNKWKGMESETIQYFEHAPRQSVKSVAKLAQSIGTASRRSEGGKILVPDLPVPEDKNPMRRISYTKALSDIKIVGKILLASDNPEPAEVGKASFDYILKNGAK